jgi:hypothetical protein
LIVEHSTKILKLFRFTAFAAHNLGRFLSLYIAIYKNRLPNADAGDKFHRLWCVICIFANLQICKTQNKKAKGYTLLNQ